MVEYTNINSYLTIQIDNFENHLRVNYQSNTVDLYSSKVREFLSWYSAKRIADFKKHLRSIGHQPTMIDCYCSGVAEYISWCAANDNGESLAEITTQDVKSFLEWCEQDQVMISKKTLQGKLKAIRYFFDYLIDVKIIKINPTADILIPRDNKET